MSGNTTIYYVVPVVPDEGSTESVYYYYKDSPVGEWIKVASSDLYSRRHGCTADQVTLQQLSPEMSHEHTGLPLARIDGSVQLYAGVARTLHTEVDPLPTGTYSAKEGVITIPVEQGTTRGVILVFSKTPERGMPPDQINQLIATTDPEIKGGVGSEGG